MIMLTLTHGHGGNERMSNLMTGQEAFNRLFGEHPLTSEEQDALGQVLASSNDGWPFYLKQQIPSFDDVQWMRLLRLISAHCTKFPPPIWFARFLVDMAEDATSTSDSCAWKQPGRRLLQELGISSD